MTVKLFKCFNIANGLDRGFKHNPVTEFVWAKDEKRAREKINLIYADKHFELKSLKLSLENAIQSIKETIRLNTNHFSCSLPIENEMEQVTLSEIESGEMQIIDALQLRSYSIVFDSKMIDPTNWHVQEVPLPEQLGDRKIFAVTTEDDVSPDAQLVIVAIDEYEVCEKLIQMDSEDESLIEFVNSLDFIEGDILEEAFQVVPEKEVKIFFQHSPRLGEIYLRAQEGKEVVIPREMYEYVARYGNWCLREIKELPYPT